jgi:hypothetical protein
VKGGVVAGALLLLAVSTSTAAGVVQAPDQVGKLDRARGTTFVRSVLTEDGSWFRMAPAAARGVTVSDSARTVKHEDWNRREVFRRPGARATKDQTSCATWSRESDPNVQEGLAVRIREGVSGRVRAVTLTKNTMFNVHSVLNVLTWDTARLADPWQEVGQFDMAPALIDDGLLRPFPWRVCLRAVGPRVSFKVWFPGVVAEPSWTDATYARSANLPRRFLAAGRPGWYVGHLPKGGSVTYRRLVTR